MQSLTRIFVYVSFVMMNLLSLAQAQTWQDELPQAKLLGSGDLTWYRLKIYTAQLWSEKKPFDINASFALALTYQRSITREQFVKTSVDEIKRLSGNQYSMTQLKRWESEMNRVFIDVKAGDQLIAVHLPNAGCRFYAANKYLAEITDPVFAKAFFAIWFDEKTKEPGLRNLLLGSTK